MKKRYIISIMSIIVLLCSCSYSKVVSRKEKSLYENEKIESSEDREYLEGEENSKDEESSNDGKNSIQETSVDEETSGYQGEVQEQYVFVNGNLYVRRNNLSYKILEEDIEDKYNGYKFYGVIEVENNDDIPKENLNSSNVNVGTKIYTNLNNTDEVIVYINGSVYFFRNYSFYKS